MSPEPSVPTRRRYLSTAGTIALVMAVGGTAVTAGYFLRAYLEGRTTPELITVRASEPQSPADTERRPDFRLPDPSGRLRDVSEWDGKLLILNFWATWCPPCLHEIPMFMEVQKAYADRGVQFVGVAIDDVENVQTFVADTGLSYPTLHGQGDAIELGKRLGNTTGGLPFTVIIGPEGNIRFRHGGVLDKARTEDLIESVLAQ